MPHDLVSLRQQRATAYDTLSALAMPTSSEEQAAFDAAAAVVESADRDIANEELRQRLRRDTAKGPQPAPGEAPTGFMSRYRDMPAQAHLVQPGCVLSPVQAAAFGDLLMATRRARLTGTRDPLLIDAALGSNEMINEDGGFLVEKDIADGLLARTFAVANLAGLVRRVPISARSNGLKMNALKDSDRTTGARWGGLQTYWIGEGDSLTPSRPKFRQMALELKKIAGLLYATSELLADATALSSVISQAFPSEFAFMIDDAIFEGSGTGQPLGFMNGGGKLAIAKETGQASATVVFENIIKMFARLPARSIGSATWFINQDVYPALQQMTQVVGTGGVPVYLPPGGLSGSPYGTLLGRPVVPIEYCSTLGTEGDIVLCDPSQYVMIDKGDIQYATSIHVAFLTDEQAFRFIYRVDGQPIDNTVITPFKGTATQATFITLATR